MILRKVGIKNFRCFQEAEVSLDQTTVLIGENNSGKTSFLDAIRLCLSRAGTRRGSGIEDYDYHLSTSKAQPEQVDNLSIILDFELAEDESEDLVQTLGDVVIFDESNVRHVILRLSSGFDSAINDFSPDWDFLDAKGSPLGVKTKRLQLLNTFLQLTPVFYLSALRDATKEFQGRSSFWAPFLRNPGIPDEVRDRLQSEIDELNKEVLGSHAPLQAVKTHLSKVQEIVSLGSGGKVDIEALPARILDLLSRAQVNITASTGASLPLTRHGSGTQSLAVLFLFEAFFATMLTQQYDELSRPILALEEPESHLHPCAVRSLWVSLGAIAGQKIIATHSGDLLARVPLTAIRRFCRQNGKVQVCSVRPGVLTPEEEKRIDFHLQNCRGELLFARCWLLGEGESEYWVFRETADILGYDLDRLGVRIVNTRYSGVEVLVKVANELGIGWCFVGDGDGQGQSDRAVCQKYLQRRDATKVICILPRPNIEVVLCESGFGHIYETHVSPQKKSRITVTKGAPDYWVQVVSAQPNKDKPTRIREVMVEMRAGGPKAVPPTLKAIIEAAIKTAEIQA